MKCVCENCGSEFQPKWTATGRFCSRSCNLRHLNTPERNAVISRETADKRSATLRNKNPSKGYVKSHGRHEHRTVAEKTLGRPLAKGEIVHHKNHDKRDNRPENLEVMTQSEHAKLHGLIQGLQRKEVMKIPYLDGHLYDYQKRAVAFIERRDGRAGVFAEMGTLSGKPVSPLPISRANPSSAFSLLRPCPSPGYGNGKSPKLDSTGTS